MRTFCDDWEQASHNGDLVHAVEAGAISRGDVTQLGDVLSGTAPGREAPDDITVFDSTGLAIQDLAIGIEVVKRFGAAANEIGSPASNTSRSASRGRRADGQDRPFRGAREGHWAGEGVLGLAVQRRVSDVRGADRVPHVPKRRPDRWRHLPQQQGEKGLITYFNVEDIDSARQKVQDLGGKAEDKHSIPGMGWFARAEDTEGNEFSLWQSDENAPPEEPQG